MMDVTLVGTSALLPLPGRAESVAHVSCGGRNILFDCGEGTQCAARAAGVSIMRLDVIALTHYHGDHIFGLPGMLQTMSVLGRTEPLTIVGPEGLETELDPILRLTGSTAFEIRLVHMPEDGLVLLKEKGLELRLTAFPTRHRVPSCGYTLLLSRAGRFLPEMASALGVPVQEWRRLQHGECIEVNGETIAPEMVLGAPRRGLKLVFTGDTSPCESLERAAEGADLLICDATYAEDEQETLALEVGHTTFSMAARLAKSAGAHMLWLTHYSQMIREPDEYLEATRAIFPGTVCGCDGMRTTLRFEENEG